MSNERVRILFSEGSSTNAREMITALGLAGYRVDLLDPSPVCLGRFSRFVCRVHRCPPSGADPIGYLRTVLRVLRSEHYDVLFPANEQAYLFAWARELLAPLTGLAVADLAAFRRVQSKAAFVGLLDELGLAHPSTRLARDWAGVEAAVAGLGTPCFVKTSVGTASTGVWRIDESAALCSLRSALTATGRLVVPGGFVVQAQAAGAFEQSHGVFDHGRLVALSCTRRLVEGAQGGAAVKQGVARPEVERDYRLLGRRLDWHGSFSADYFWDAERRRPSYIDANPRITEPMNAYVNGVNLADLQVRLSLGEHPESIAHATRGAVSHTLVQVLLGAAETGSRTEILRAAAGVALRRGWYRYSREGMTPVLADPPAVVGLLVVLGSLLADPVSGRHLATATIERYSMGEAITRLERHTPGDVASTAPAVALT